MSAASPNQLVSSELVQCQHCNRGQGQGRVTLELWDAARLHLNSTFGHSPHPKQVASLAMAMLAGKSPGEVLISSVWGSYKPS